VVHVPKPHFSNRSDNASEYRMQIPLTIPSPSQRSGLVASDVFHAERIKAKFSGALCESHGACTRRGLTAVEVIADKAPVRPPLELAPHAGSAHDYRESPATAAINSSAFGPLLYLHRAQTIIRTSHGPHRVIKDVSRAATRSGPRPQQIPAQLPARAGHKLRARPLPARDRVPKWS
jgi:hypothetical protein